MIEALSRTKNGCSEREQPIRPVTQYRTSGALASRRCLSGFRTSRPAEKLLRPNETEVVSEGLIFGKSRFAGTFQGVGLCAVFLAPRPCLWAVSTARTVPSGRRRRGAWEFFRRLRCSPQGPSSALSYRKSKCGLEPVPWKEPCGSISRSPSITTYSPERPNPWFDWRPLISRTCRSIPRNTRPPNSDGGSTSWAMKSPPASNLLIPTRRG